MTSDHVVILGAGFSRSVSTHMPLTDELGAKAISELQAAGRLPATRLTFGPELTFETWLSLLSDEQPQLSEAENRENAALFARLRDAIATILLEAQFSVIAQPAPAWLYELTSVLHHERATVITFNYDKLIETAVLSHSLWDPFHSRLVAANDVLRGLPPLPSTGQPWLLGPRSDTFKLLKLHGSVDWWAVPGDTSGATLVREPTTSVFETPAELTKEGRQEQLPGRERFIIPPLAAKSIYYRNPLSRELWQQAFDALQAASRVSILGYSLPPADTVMANMLRVALADRQVAVDVVNPSPRHIVSSLAGFGLASSQITSISTSDCVARFTQHLCDEASSNLADDLRERVLAESPDASVAVAWGDSSSSGKAVFRVLDAVVRDETTLVLVLAEDTPRGGATAARFDVDGTPSRRTFATAADLARVIGDCTRLVAQSSTGVHTLVAARHDGRNVGANPRWLMFIPADRGPEEATIRRSDRPTAPPARRR